MILKESIAALPENRSLIQSPETILTRDDITGLAASPELVGVRVALSIVAPDTALRLLAILDGVADHIVLLSPTLDPVQAVQLAQQSQCDAVLCDDPAGFPSADGVPVCADLETLSKVFTRAGVQPTQTRWIMTTSGTTGTPKLVGHTLASLCRSSKTDPTRGQGQRWGMLYDYTRFAGLQVFLQSILSGALLIAPDYAASLETKLDMFVRHGCTHLSGTPTLWRKIIMTPGSEQLCLVQITLGGEIADDRILKAVGTTYPQARVVHIFASTEAGVGFSVADGRSGFPESYLAAPPPGVQIRVEDDQLYVRNCDVAPKYLGTDTGFTSKDGWVATGDSVVRKDGRVFFQGRANGVINVGGDKVHPEEVEHVLLAYPGVAMAQVYSKANPITGALVAADVILTSADIQDRKAFRDGLRTHAAAQLERHKVPAMFRIVSEFEMNAAGKLIRKKP